MKDELVDLYAKMKNAHQELYLDLIALRKTIRKPKKIEDLADSAYTLRKCFELANDLRKEFDGAKTLAERTACLLAVSTDHFDTIRGELTTATPMCKQAAQIPSRSKNREEYNQFCEAMSIPLELAEQDVVRIHWPGVVEHLTRLQSNGERLPEGIDPNKTYPVYSLRCQPAAGVDIDELAGHERTIE